MKRNISFTHLPRLQASRQSKCHGGLLLIEWSLFENKLDIENLIMYS